jgi:cell division initiation protein
MPLSPLDIHNKEFAKTFRGYDEDEVNEFLDLIIKDYETLIRENKELNQKVASLQEQLNHFATLEDTLSKTLLVAQEAAEEVKNNAKAEANLIKKVAEKNANKLVEDALSERAKIQNQMILLKREALAFKARLSHSIQAQLDILNSTEWAEIGKSDVAEFTSIESTTNSAELPHHVMNEVNEVKS